MQPGLITLLEQLRAAFPAKPIQSEGAFQDWGATYLDAEPYAIQINPVETDTE